MQGRTLLCVALVIVAFSMVHAEDGADDNQRHSFTREIPLKTDTDQVILLDKSSFTAFINANRITLVEFVAPNCPKCDKIAPEYAAAFKELAAKNILIGRVDASKSPELIEFNNVVGYPTILVFQGGANKGMYSGEMTKKGFVSRLIKPSQNKQEEEEVIFEDLTNEGPYTRDSDKVIKLNEANFDDFINLQKSVLVAFVSPSCGWCHRLAPEFAAAAKELESEGYYLVRVDATANPALAEKFQVGGYPTLLLFVGGEKVSQYQGERTKEALKNFMKGTIVEATTETEATLLTKRKFSSNAPFLVYRGPGSGSLYNRFKSVIQTSAVLNMEIAEIEASEADEQVVFYQSWTEIQFTGETNGTVLEPKDITSATISQLKRPLIYEWKEQEWFRDPNIPNPNPCVRVFYDGKDPESFKEAYYALAPVAKKYKSKLTFSLNEKERFAKDLEKLRLDDESVKHPFYVHDFLLQKRFRTANPQTATAEAVEKVIEGIFDKTLKPFWIKSESIPETQGLVQKVVSDNFHDAVWKYLRDYVLIVYEGSKKDTALEQLFSLFEQTAKVVREELPEDKIAFGTIDADLNELPEVYSVAAYPLPALVIAGANNKLSPGGFTGLDGEEETVESLLDAIQSSAYSYRQFRLAKEKEVAENMENIKDEL